MRTAAVLGAVAVVEACSSGPSTARAPGPATAAGTTQMATAATGCNRDDTDRSDLDGDYQSDIAVGMPAYDDGAGAVDVRETRSEPLLLRARDSAGRRPRGTGSAAPSHSATSTGIAASTGC